MTPAMTPQDALIAVMIVTAAADNAMSDKEMREITATVGILPIFRGYDRERITHVSNTVVDLLSEEEGVDALMGLVVDALPVHLRETAYALACDVAAADESVKLEEMRLLETLRYVLRLDRLNCAAIERGSRARHMHA